MITKETTIEQLTEVTTIMSSMAAGVQQQAFNTIPFEGSWTVGQLLQHIIKSDSLTLAALKDEAKPTTTRNGDENIEKLKDIFLDFDKKLNAPVFIVPEENEYDKETMLTHFMQGRKEMLRILAETDALATCTTHVVFKEHTRLEIIWFIIFHTMRHNRQLERIIAQL